MDAYIFTSKSKDAMAKGLGDESYELVGLDSPLSWKAVQKAWAEGEVLEKIEGDICSYTLKSNKGDEIKVVLKSIE